MSQWPLKEDIDMPNWLFEEGSKKKIRRCSTCGRKLYGHSQGGKCGACSTLGM